MDYYRDVIKLEKIIMINIEEQENIYYICVYVY